MTTENALKIYGKILWFTALKFVVEKERKFKHWLLYTHQCVAPALSIHSYSLTKVRAK